MSLKVTFFCQKTAGDLQLFRAAASLGAARLFPTLWGVIRHYYCKDVKKAQKVAQCLRRLRRVKFIHQWMGFLGLFIYGIANLIFASH
jgi:hypothetical protein